MRDVAIIGVGIGQFGEIWDKSFRDLFVDAALVLPDDSQKRELDPSDEEDGSQDRGPPRGDYMGIEQADDQGNRN